MRTKLFNSICIFVLLLSLTACEKATYTFKYYLDNSTNDTVFCVYGDGEYLSPTYSIAPYEKFDLNIDGKGDNYTSPSVFLRSITYMKLETNGKVYEFTMDGEGSPANIDNYVGTPYFSDKGGEEDPKFTKYYLFKLTDEFLDSYNY